MISSKKYNKHQTLIILSRFPYPLDKGDKLRAYYQIRELSTKTDSTLITLSDKKITTEQKKIIKQYCKNLIIIKINWFSKLFNILLSLFSGKPLQVGYFYSFKAQKKINQLIKNNSFDHIYNQLIRTTEYTKNIHHIKKTLDYMDALSAGMERRRKTEKWLMKLLVRFEAKRLRIYEQKIFDYFDYKIIISEQDKELIFHPEKQKIKVIPNGVDDCFFEKRPRQIKYDFVFVGNMSYPPNIEAVHYIHDEILPHFPSAKLLVSGVSPDKSILELQKKNKNITVSGWVDDIRESYLSGKIFLAPMIIGTGMQNKLLEAMALGVPCVTTNLANNAINATHLDNIMIGDTPSSIIEGIQVLLNDKDQYQKIRENAQHFVKTKYQWTLICEKLSNLIRKRH